MNEDYFRQAVAAANKMAAGQQPAAQKVPAGTLVTREIWQATRPPLTTKPELTVDADAAETVAKAAAFAAQAAASVKSMMAKHTGVQLHADPVRLTPDIQARLAAWPVPRLMAIGASTGGTDALAAVLEPLQPPMPPILVVQHIPPVFSRMFAARLDAESNLTVQEAADGMHLLSNHIYIAPGAKHMSLRQEAGQFCLNVQPGLRVNSVCPAVDVLFASVAEYIGRGALGILLTGMGRDGADGLLAMRQAGAHTLGQDQASCVVYGMPKAAWDCGAVEQQLNLQDMATALHAIMKHKTDT